MFNKTIQMFIFDGNPNGRIMCELSNWNGRVYKIARNELNLFSDRCDANNTGIYFLFGKNELNKDSIYIGEAEKVSDRLKQHLNDHVYWNDCVAVISKDNLRFKVNGSTIRVAFPTKAYLQYSMNVYRGNAYDLYGVSKMPDSDRTTLTDSLDINQNFYKMDSVYSTSFPALSAGSYQVVIKVDGFGCYETSYIVSDPITIEALDVKEGTRIESAGYMDDGKTIRISWRPAVDSNYKEWPVDNYKVYLKDSNHIYTDSNVTVKADNKYGNTIYYAEYTVPDNDVEYDFYVLLSDGDKVEDNSGKDDEENDKSISRKVGPYGGLDWARRGWAWADFTDMEDQDINNDALLVITVPDNKVTVGSVKYKIIGPKTNTDEGWNKYTDTNLYNDSELKEAAAVPVELIKSLRVILMAGFFLLCDHSCAAVRLSDLPAGQLPAADCILARKRETEKYHKGMKKGLINVIPIPEQA